jgi:serine/threonine protein kinase/formylglycine-generating enzyme required for sulfatase activity
MSQAEQQERLTAVLGDKYRILCLIGGGGMAQVYLARHRFHGGLFAIKVLAEQLAQDARIVSRFEREARMAASLGSHPNIVPIFDIGEGAGLYFLVMQFIAGEDMAGFLKREGKLPLADAANVIAQTAEALSCAEGKRIVHRDLKPANMLLDEAGRIKLLDFGISRIHDSADGLTRPGESMGTPFYMSPEQIRGEDCDIRSDLYSLGVVFFELLTGQRPFYSEVTSAVLLAHMMNEPPSLLTLDPSLAPACDAMVQKLMAKRAEDRFQSTTELLELLRSYGTTTGPGRLRPSVDAGLRQSIEQAERVPLDAHTGTGSTRTRVSTPNGAGTVAGLNVEDSAISAAPDTATPEMDHSGAGVAPAPEVVPAALPVEQPRAQIEAHQDAQPKARWPIWLAVGVLIAIAAVAAVLYRSHTATSPTQPVAAPKSTLPQTYADAHGKMLLVPQGPFTFGSTDDHSAQNVALPAFYIDETEVSNAEYRQFCEATGHAPPQSADYVTHPDYPVTTVSYDDAAAYAAWAGRRLPTEEEWEKAARGTDNRSFPWGNTPWTDNVPNHLEPVGSDPTRRSPYGAYNMAGNVWEWTASPYTPTADENGHMKQLLKGQSFSSEWRIIKGGSFGPGASDDFDLTRHRGLPSDGRSPWIGFRCVRSAPTA